MEVQVQSSKVFAEGHPAVATEVPLTVFDRLVANMHVAVLFAFSPPTPSNSAIIEGLLKTLHHFPTLTATMGETTDRNLPCLVVGGPDGGVLVTEATVASKLSDHLPLEPSPDFFLLHPSLIGASQLLQVQLNRFQCGGLVIAVTNHHRVADGQSMGSFFTAWAKTVRGVPIDPLPSYDMSWLNPRSPPRCEFKHWGDEFKHRDGFSLKHKEIEFEKIDNILLHYSPDFVAELKVRTNGKHSTFETMLAHLWRKITIARDLGEDEYTEAVVSVNGRPRLQRPVPREYFGNLVLRAKPRIKVKELVDGGVAGAARVVRETLSEFGDDYFTSFIDFGAIHAEDHLVPVYDTLGTFGNNMSPDIEVDSWLGFPFHEVDFGGGGALRGFLPSWIPEDGVVILITSMHQEGGIDALVTLQNEHASKLKKISHSLE